MLPLTRSLAGGQHWFFLSHGAGSKYVSIYGKKNLMVDGGESRNSLFIAKSIGH